MHWIKLVRFFFGKASAIPQENKNVIFLFPIGNGNIFLVPVIIFILFFQYRQKKERILLDWLLKMMMWTGGQCVFQDGRAVEGKVFFYCDQKWLANSEITGTISLQIKFLILIFGHWSSTVRMVKNWPVDNGLGYVQCSSIGWMLPFFISLEIGTKRNASSLFQLIPIDGWNGWMNWNAAADDDDDKLKFKPNITRDSVLVLMICVRVSVCLSACQYQLWSLLTILNLSLFNPVLFGSVFLFQLKIFSISFYLVENLLHWPEFEAFGPLQMRNK